MLVTITSAIVQLDYQEPLYLLLMQILLSVKEIHHAFCKYPERKWFANEMRTSDMSSDILPSEEMVICKRLKVSHPPGTRTRRNIEKEEIHTVHFVETREKYMTGSVQHTTIRN